MTREEWEAEALKSECRAEAERKSFMEQAKEIDDDMKEFVVPIAYPDNEYDYDQEPF